MDPNANLKEQIELACKLQDYERDDDASDVCRLAELVLALNEWISKGGFLPAKWVKS